MILVENRDFFIPHLHSTTPLGDSPSEYCNNVWYRKTRLVDLPDSEKIENIFIHFYTIHECCGHPDTARRHRPRYALRRAAKSNQGIFVNSEETTKTRRNWPWQLLTFPPQCYSVNVKKSTLCLRKNAPILASCTAVVSTSTDQFW